jgi:hypothetical protein
VLSTSRTSSIPLYIAKGKKKKKFLIRGIQPSSASRVFILLHIAPFPPSLRPATVILLFGTIRLLAVVPYKETGLKGPDNHPVSCAAEPLFLPLPPFDNSSGLSYLIIGIFQPTFIPFGFHDFSDRPADTFAGSSFF